MEKSQITFYFPYCFFIRNGFIIFISLIRQDKLMGLIIKSILKIIKSLFAYDTGLTLHKVELSKHDSNSHYNSPNIFRLLTFFYFLSIGLFAQNSAKIDSLEKVASSASSDTAVVGALGDLFMEYIHNDPEKAFQFAEKGLKLAEKCKLKKIIAAFHNNFGYYFQQKGNHQKALECYKKALVLKQESGDRNGTARTFLNIGNVFYENNNIEDALSHYLQALEIFDDMGDKQSCSYCMNNLGVIYDEQKNYVKALDFYNQSAIIKKEIGDKNGLAKCWLNMGIIYTNIGDNKKSEIFLNQALATASEIKNYYLLCNIYSSFGQLGFNEKKYKQAEDNYLKAIEFATELDDLDEIHSLYEGLISVYEKTADFKSAFFYQTEYLKLHDSILNNQYNNKLAALAQKHNQGNALIVKTNDKEQPNKIVRVLAFFCGVLIFVVVILAYYIFKKKKIDRMANYEKFFQDKTSKK